MMRFFFRGAAALVFLGLVGCVSTPPNPVGASSSESRAADAIIDRWIEGLGGERAIRKLASLETRQSFQFDPGARKMEIHMRKVASGNYRFEGNLSGVGELAEGFDGRTAWRENPSLGFGLIPTQELINTLQTDDFLRPLKTRLMYPRRRKVADETLGGRSFQVLAMGGRDGVTEKWLFAADTGRLMRVERPPLNSAGTPIVMEYSDYRKVGEFAYAFGTERTEGANKITMRYASVRPNVPIDQKIFTPPADRMREAKEVERILAKHLDAIGGIEPLARISTRVITASVEVTTSGIKLHTTITQKRPNLIVSEQDMPGMGRSSQGFDGRTGWSSSDMQGYRTLADAELQSLVSNSDVRVDAQLRERCPMRTLLGERDVNGRPAYAIKLASLQGVAGTYFFDKENGRLVRIESVFNVGPQSNLRAALDFSDFRNVEGVIMPFVTTMTNPAMRTVTTLESVKVNVPVDDAIFRPRKDD
ncbi:MAG: hypothetical protein JWM32_1235 [Verrucomicrobia bacterium]|nr:hypothetical protein [Verrucomicrobiota bacterium]